MSETTPNLEADHPGSDVKMDTSAKPTFILVHGAWQSSSVWVYVTALLEKAGYSVYPVTLKSPNVNPAVQDFSADVEVVKDAIESVIESGKDAVLAVHSYAGIVGCEALKSFHHEMLSVAAEEASEDAAHGDKPIHRRGKVLHLAFIAGLIYPPGMSLADLDTRPPPGIVQVGEKGDWVRIMDGDTRMYNDLSPEAAGFWNKKLKLQSRHVFYSELTYPAYRYYPSSYLTCSADQAVLPKTQSRMMMLARIKQANVVKINAGHSPMISQPGAVAKFLRKAAGEVSSVL
ncbi:hypothetical protein AJ80_06672 [Polytolypa hystricis UAMH7299]|uniref:AB hydrolase-1 domain-containing protein n=1 Tax=Polytolypa hystricis (strain UAMH7299) TaxID=1447883 RepID=A0A2B7XV17_POLH7|nr:hypothetical protein AJ80_06672 [Polytolypa hystricis UAMH7299]